MKINLIFLVDEDFINYKKANMFIGMPTCTFKCGIAHCQNAALKSAEPISIEIHQLIKRYQNNPITKSIVFGGLEPFDSWEDLSNFIREFRKECQDDIVIYSGYNREEINEDVIKELHNAGNIIVKWGRYVPNDNSHYDDILGVKLASSNQYAEVI